MNLSEWADSQGIAHVTAYRWFHKGTLPVPAKKIGGLILVDVPGASTASDGETVVYARVSSADQKPDLDRQVSRVTQWATSNGLTVDRIVIEVGSALNGKRRKLSALLKDPSVKAIVVEHRDRLTRFGFDFLDDALRAQGRRLVVVDDAEINDDIVRDTTEVLTSLCARLYGKRAAANRAKKALEAVGIP